jgi:hypothetical protein
MIVEEKPSIAKRTDNAEAQRKQRAAEKGKRQDSHVSEEVEKSRSHAPLGMTKKHTKEPTYRSDKFRIGASPAGLGLAEDAEEHASGVFDFEIAFFFGDSDLTERILAAHADDGKAFHVVNPA